MGDKLFPSSTFVMRLACTILLIVYVTVNALAREPGALSKPVYVEPVDPAVAQSLMQEALGDAVGTRWALLAGVNRYAFPTSAGFSITPLRVAVHDVQSVAEFLKDPGRGNFPNEQVFILTDEQATKRNILKTLNTIVQRAGPKDLVFFYFSGHGYYDGSIDLAYLLPHDAEMDDPATTCIDFLDLRKRFDSLKANKLITILDACHSGGVKQQGAMAVEEGPYRYYLQAFEGSQGRPMLLSSDAKEVSWEMQDGAHSVFTHFLLKGMDGAADFDKDGIVGFAEVARYVEQQVPQFTTSNSDAYPTVQRPTRRDSGGQIRGDIPVAIVLDTLQGIRQTLDDFADELKALQRFKGNDAGKLGAGSVDRMTQYAMRVKEREIRKRTLAPEERGTLNAIEQLIAGKITVSEYQEEQDRLYPQGLPSVEDLQMNGNGVLLVKTTPMGAAVYVDGRFMAYSPREIRNLPAGQRRVRLVVAGKPPVEHLVVIRDGVASKLIYPSQSGRSW